MISKYAIKIKFIIFKEHNYLINAQFGRCDIMMYTLREANYCLIMSKMMTVHSTDEPFGNC